MAPQSDRRVLRYEPAQGSLRNRIWPARGAGPARAIGANAVNKALYTDPETLKKYPHFPMLLKSIETAVPRPKVVKYGDATLAMQDAAYAALQGNTTPEAALSGLQTKLEQLTQ